MSEQEHHWLDEEAGPIVRPYAITRGRTRADKGSLDLTAQVITTGRNPAGAPLGAEQRSIVDWCRRPLSVVEISAYLDLPVGVIRVLLGDLLDLGLVAVHQAPAIRAVPDVHILEKVIHGLRAI